MRSYSSIGLSAVIIRPTIIMYKQLMFTDLYHCLQHNPCIQNKIQTWPIIDCWDFLMCN